MKRGKKYPLDCSVRKCTTECVNWGSGGEDSRGQAGTGRSGGKTYMIQALSTRGSGGGGGLGAGGRWWAGRARARRRECSTTKGR